MFYVQVLKFGHIYHPRVQDGTTRIAVWFPATPDWTQFTILPTVEMRANILQSRNHPEQVASLLLNGFIITPSHIPQHVIGEVHV
jgi:hypothetical protein